jgi:hypothetical protein
MFLKYDSVRKRFFDPDGVMVITPRPDGSGIDVAGEGSLSSGGGGGDGITMQQVNTAVSGHNADTNAHADIRQAITNETETRIAVDQSLSNAITSAVSGLSASIGEVNTTLADKLDAAHNTAPDAHNDIRAQILPATTQRTGVTRLASVGSLLGSNDDDVITAGLLRSLFTFTAEFSGEWEIQQMPPPSGGTNLWGAVAYGNGVFVAVTNAGKVATSTDGLTWAFVATLPGANNNGYKMVYGNGIFVVVRAQADAAFTSPDGINWTQGTLPAEANWNCITYGNGVFVAMIRGTEAFCATSPDGINWTQRTLPASGYWNGITYGNGLFVAVANGNIAITSPDGITWTQRTLPVSATWIGVAYGNGVFAAVAYNTIAAYSPNGITWTQRTLPVDGYWRFTYYGLGVFMTGASAGFLVSSDGITWTQSNVPSPGLWEGAADGNGILVVIAYGGANYLLVSTPNVEVEGL